MEYPFSQRIGSLKASAIREILKYTVGSDVVPFAAGNPAPDAFPTKEVAQIVDEALREGAFTDLSSLTPQGYGPLVEEVRKLVPARYTPLRPEDDCLILSGATQGMDLAVKLFCSEGDTILCEDPSFIGSLNSFRSQKLELRGIPLEADGVSIPALEEALRSCPRARMLYLIPNFQNPTGQTMSLEKRQAVYRLAKEHGLMILEDNPYGDLRFAGEEVPAIKSLDTEGLVIYVGSFSKIIAPGLRVGFVAADREIIRRMAVLKADEDQAANLMAQIICARYVSRYDLAGHIQEARAIYRRKCALMLEEMDRTFSPKVTYTRPEGGLFLWCTLPDGADMADFCTRSVRDYQVATVPGTAFTVAEGARSQCFRLNYSTPTDEQIVRGIRTLGRLTHELL